MFSLYWSASYFPWRGAVMKAAIRTPIYNELNPNSTAAEAGAVRSDSFKYLGRTDVHLEQLAYDQVFNLPYEWLARGEVGFFEAAYGGVGTEIFRFFDEGRWGVGLEAEWVKKRDEERDFRFLDSSPTYELVFLNVYHKLIPSLGLDIGLKLGRFLAGDWGGRLDVSRTYKHFTLGAWYTVTDTDDFESYHNRGYHDKGLYLSIPFSLFTDRDHPRKLFYGIKPWGRDTGQTVAQINSLYPMAARGSINDFKQTIEELKD